jgi:predicted metal-binding membrane protein
VNANSLQLDRTAIVAMTALAAATAIAWIGLVRFPHAMELPGFLAGWTLMMAAMMLPSIAPLVLLYRGSRVILAAGYLLVWAATGLVPFVAMNWTMFFERRRATIVLAAAGLYELTPLKTACLKHCRNPATFLIRRFGRGPLGLGVEHGLWCAGCCVGLMAVLAFAASMTLGWAVAIAAVVFVQKVLPWSAVTARLTGAALIVAAIVLTF